MWVKLGHDQYEKKVGGSKAVILLRGRFWSFVYLPREKEKEPEHEDFDDLPAAKRWCESTIKAAVKAGKVRVPRTRTRKRRSR